MDNDNAYRMVLLPVLMFDDKDAEETSITLINKTDACYFKKKVKPIIAISIIVLFKVVP